jgi:hypothetical protein
MYTSNMSVPVEGYAEKMLKETVGQIFQEIDEEQMKLKMEGILTSFADFCKIVKNKYFDTMWFVQFGNQRRREKME